MEHNVIGWAILITITLVGTIAQTAIGFGFALITVPVFLLVLNVSTAVQSAMILSFIIALAMVFYTWRDTPFDTFKAISLGSIAGFPLGFFLFQIATPDAIKIAVGVAILLALGLTRSRTSGGPDLKATTLSGLICGVVSGAMVTSIAMAGPAIAVYAAIYGFSKAASRSIIFSVFIFSYGVALLIHGFSYGFSDAVLEVSAYLIPVVILGIVIGRWIAGRISEHFFNKLLTYTLIGVSGYLIVSVL